MKILIINGKGRVGKDTFCQFISEKKGLVYIYSTVDKVKEYAKLLGWDGNKDAKGRKFLSDIKDAMTEYNDGPHQYIVEQIKQVYEKYKDDDMIRNNLVFLIHSREPDDIERWVNENNARAILIRSETREQTWNNHADDDVFDCIYDYIVYNDGSLEEWKETAGEFINEVKKEKWESHI